MAKILKGKDVVDSLNAKLSAEIEELKAKGTAPVLGIMRVGERPDDLSYERGALKRAEKVGMGIRQYIFPEDVSEEEILKAIEDINRDDSVHGVLILRPLPKTIDDEKVRKALAPEKDIDGITDESQAGRLQRQRSGIPSVHCRSMH